MNKVELNKIMVLMRSSEDKYYTFRKRNRGRILRDVIGKKLSKKGFNSYIDIKMSCPMDMKLGDYLYQLVK